VPLEPHSFHHCAAKELLGGGFSARLVCSGLFSFVDHDSIAFRWQRVRKKADEPKLFTIRSARTMGDTAGAGVKLAGLGWNPFAIDVIFSPPFIYINKLIDLRVDMPAQDHPLAPDENHLSAR